MPVEETKHDLMLKRVQIVIGILAGLTAFAVGVYNVKKTYFEKPEEKIVALPPSPPPQQPDKLRSALEDVGASWLETLKKKQDP